MNERLIRLSFLADTFLGYFSTATQMDFSAAAVSAGAYAGHLSGNSCGFVDRWDDLPVGG
ncbi:MAG: hypothetical protein NZ899_08525 [Thermoguttaceae bacterium]|nr:hypothetical protein [Thermoguttaceae bacterium]MDW8078338.1 hypothetical protein [Thermoguttaceae bacterium]